MKTIEERIAELEERADNQSKFLAMTVGPALEEVAEQMGKVWISDDRFRELERAVADIAAIIMKQNAKWADQRVGGPRYREEQARRLRRLIDDVTPTM